MKKKLAVIIVTYNSEELIESCIDSVIRFNDIGDSLEIIVVDNCSRNQVTMFENLEMRYPNQLKLINNQRNDGYGQGNNIGVAAATAPIIMIMNPDVTLFKPIFSSQLMRFEIDPALGIIGTQQYENALLYKNDSFITKMPYISHLFLHKIFRKLNYFLPKFFCFSGACFFVRKSSFEEAGRFDERIFLYGEETDLQYRIENRATANRIYFNKRDGYIHPQHNRDFNIKTYIEGFKSFMIVAENQNIDNYVVYKRIMRYYKLLAFYFFLKNTSLSKFYKTLRIELRREYKNRYDQTL